MSISVFWPSTRAWGSWRSTEWATSRRAPSATTESLCTGKKGKIAQGICKGNLNTSCEQSRNFSLEPGFTLPWFLKSWWLRERWIFLQAQLRLNFLLSSVFCLWQIPPAQKRAALLRRYLKGATCGLLFCFHLTGPSTCYLWLLLIEINAVKNINIDNKVVLSNEQTGMGEVSDLPVRFSEREPEFFLLKMQKIRHPQNMQKRECDVVASFVWLHFVLVIRKFRSRCQLFR